MIQPQIMFRNLVLTILILTLTLISYIVCDLSSPSLKRHFKDKVKSQMKIPLDQVIEKKSSDASVNSLPMLPSDKENETEYVFPTWLEETVKNTSSVTLSRQKRRFLTFPEKSYLEVGYDILYILLINKTFKISVYLSFSAK